MGFVPRFHFWQNREEKSLCRYSRKKKRLSRLWKQEAKKSKNWPFSKGVTPWFWSKNGIFFHLFIFGKIGKKKVSGHILGRKHAFLDYNNKKEKTSKNWPFSTGVSPWFWSKNEIFFHLFIFGKIGKKKDFSDILERKNSFLDYKNKKQNKTKKKKKGKRKNGLFPHGLVHGFGPQVGFVPRFHFWQNTQEKSLWRYFRKKKGLYSLQKQGVKKSQNCLFKKAFGHGFGPKMGFFSTL